MEKIASIASVIEATPLVQLLGVDVGYDTNRTVMTFTGEAQAVVEAAFEAAKRASELIDMREQRGTHPRIGATDVLPLIPLSGISLEECAELARALAQRISTELGIPTYCYEAAAFRPERQNLAVCRRGEYEALASRLSDPVEAPDFGARPLDEVIARSGASCVGARDFLVAVNFNLDTTSVEVATEIAKDVRESGRRVKEGDGYRTIGGKLKKCKAIGWYIEEYDRAQVSMNLTNLGVTPLHTAFEEVSRAATEHGATVTGTEIIGLVPKHALLDAGAHFTTEHGLSEEELIKVAIRAMGLDELRAFLPSERMIF